MSLFPKKSGVSLEVGGAVPKLLKLQNMMKQTIFQ